jgi:acyl-phosphate glycerol 3-phosphate acyltransferase
VTYALLALAYLIGATPTSYIIGKAFHGIDLREHGSGNLGATNAFRILGAKSAIPVVIVDIAKGFVPTWLFAPLAGVGFGWTRASSWASHHGPCWVA